ncbi:hypothetical protein Sjap_015364 [Stephania japonica]|uniref:Uncharacterized protein n=1 Tax=Stephania japonica TaxID=461633 RepID=A0AAP0IKW5_9MAGN
MIWMECTSLENLFGGVPTLAIWFTYLQDTYTISFLFSFIIVIKQLGCKVLVAKLIQLHQSFSVSDHQCEDLTSFIMTLVDVVKGAVENKNLQIQHLMLYDKTFVTTTSLIYIADYGVMKGDTLLKKAFVAVFSASTQLELVSLLYTFLVDHILSNYRDTKLQFNMKLLIKSYATTLIELPCLLDIDVDVMNNIPSGQLHFTKFGTFLGVFWMHKNGALIITDHSLMHFEMSSKIGHVHITEWFILKKVLQITWVILSSLQCSSLLLTMITSLCEQVMMTSLPNISWEFSVFTFRMRCTQHLKMQEYIYELVAKCLWQHLYLL